MDRISEINARLAEIEAQLDAATGEALTALETEANTLIAERSSLQAEADRRQQLRSAVAAGAAGTVVSTITAPAAAPATPAPAVSAEERTAQALVNTGRMSVDADQTRSILISSGSLASPTVVHGINEDNQVGVTSLLDMVTVANTVGMSCNRVAYVVSDPDEADEQTEGSEATTKEPVYDYVDITPTSVAVTASISKQAKKQSPLNYKASVQSKAFQSLRKKAASIVTEKLKASTLVDTVAAKVSTGKGVIDEKTLRTLVLAHGGNEGVNGGVLILNKTDLMAFGDVRGANEKRAVYEITPDGSNPNIGTIKDGGLIVRYIINSKMTACSGTAQPGKGTGAKKTMFYGDPRAIELDLFSNYEIAVSTDYAITKLMETIVGDVELGADVVVNHAFTALTIPEAST